MRSDEIPSVTKVDLQVPGLGTVTGLSLNDEVDQYLGIPYAEIPGRFRRSKPAAVPWPEKKWDGTRLGPYCPQPPRDFYPVPSPQRPWLEMPAADEFNCLNLNISVPRSAPANGTLLPVMVFIHGGAFTYSMNASPIYDSRLLAWTSSALSTPTIIVTVNYRLGVYGFLAGHDIKAYNAAHGESGTGNYGIWDQVLALRWVKSHIQAFGGDPERVTLFGQSAGAVSVHCHLLRNEALFSSAILQSGLLRLCGVKSVDEYQGAFERMLIELGIPLVLSSAERMQRILDVDSERLTAAMVPAFIVPVITMSLCDDGVLIEGPMPSYEMYDNFEAPEWCPRIMMGDCLNECIIWNKSWDNLSLTPMKNGQDLSTPDAKLVLDRIASYLQSSEKAKTIAEVFHLTPNSSPQETFGALEQLTTYGMYSSLIYFAQKAHPAMYTYHFDVPSVFENAWGGLAHHSYDNVLIWGILRHLLPPKQQQVADKMAEAWIRFAAGEEPWERHDVKERWMVFGEDESAMKSKDEDRERLYAEMELLHTKELVGVLAESHLQHYDMVYYGALSKGCELCRRRKIKCDERKPSCLRCESSNRSCPGYRDLNAISFRDESLRVVRRCARRRGASVSTGERKISCNPSQPIEDLAAGFFFSKYNIYNGPYFSSISRDWLCEVYVMDPTCDLLRTAIEAIGMAGLSNTSYAPHLSVQAQDRYGKALAALDGALQDPCAATRDTTLMAVILLGLFEVVSSDAADESRYWIAHAAGAMALLQLRGPGQFARPRGGQLYVFTRSQILSACLTQGLPVPPALVNITYEFETSTLRQLWKDSNLATPGSISEICFRLVNLRAMIAQDGHIDPVSVRTEAFKLDTDLEEWKISAQVRWAYEIGCESESIDCRSFMGKYHRYANLWVARAWLNWRLMRILVNQMIIENELKLEFDEKIVSRARGIVRDLSIEICISVACFDETPHLLHVIQPLALVAEEPLNPSSVRSFAVRELYRIHRSTGVRQAGRLAEIALLLQ
ncbi:Alpha/Beta hydrolase protein [Aspergillus heterothallicus]